ncbi:NAD(P)H-binding family [Pyrrhoderma noxium]|uniref:NAD(P)H-binding family n=1 Tax=Pyrrhoderma noxium TaxID=2282107 RepID=A0A286UJI7_9AGAM|nr:NAD(P)H-binding family [Pyrrhoderma noxium]
MSAKSALLIGGTGAVGKHVLRELVLSKEFTRILEAGRRVTPLDKLPVEAKDKLEQKVIDFEKIEEAGLAEGKWDVIFITLGSTRAAAGSFAAFEKIDREYVINAARAAKDSEQRQRVVYLSSGGANSNSPFPYLRSKGLTDNGLASLGYSDTIIFRPGFLANAERTQTRILEAAGGFVTGLLSRFTSSLEIDVGLLGKSIVRAGYLGSSRLPSEAKAAQEETPEKAKFTTIGNAGAIKLGTISI